jgi:serine/threonine protein kinase
MSGERVMSQPSSTFAAYEILAELGRGTTGVVYKARNTLLNRLVALKMPFLDAAAEISLRVARFYREAEVLARLTLDPDPDFPTLYEVGEYQGQPYFVREFVEASTLEQLGMARTLSLREGLGVVTAVASAVTRVHYRGFVHRNVYPSNVLVSVAGNPKLIGFGRVGLLAGSDFLPAGATGEPAEIDVRALQQMLTWLFTALRQPLPPRLEQLRQPGSVASPGAFAEALGSYLHGR